MCGALIGVTFAFFNACDKAESIVSTYQEVAVPDAGEPVNIGVFARRKVVLKLVDHEVVQLLDSVADAPKLLNPEGAVLGFFVGHLKHKYMFNGT